MMLARPPSRVSTEIAPNGDKITTTETTTRRIDGTKVIKRKKVVTRSKTSLDKRCSSTTPGSGSGSGGRSTPRRCKTPQPLGLLNMSIHYNPDMLLQHSDTAAFEKAVKRCIPASFQLLASQDEKSQAQEDYFAMDHYKLPFLYNNDNRAGSVATSAFLELLHEDPRKFVARPTATKLDSYNCHQVLASLQKRIQSGSKLSNAKPTLSSSRPLGPPRILDTYAPFALVPPGYTGTRRALLIGVVGGGRGGKPLQAPPNDVAQMRHFLMSKGGFESSNITVLLENAQGARTPTRANIMAAFQKLVALTKGGDVCLVQYSGHGGRESHNLYIIPSDSAKAGPIRDEDIMKDLVKAMPAHTHTTMLMDCCYSGTLGDLPYVLKSDKAKQEIEIYFDTDTRAEMLHQEQSGGQQYQHYKQARNHQRLESRFNPVQMVEAAAARISDAAASATQALKDMSSMGGESMRDLMGGSMRDLMGGGSMRGESKRDLMGGGSMRGESKRRDSRRDLMGGSMRGESKRRGSTRDLMGGSLRGEPKRRDSSRDLMGGSMRGESKRRDSRRDLMGGSMRGESKRRGGGSDMGEFGNLMDDNSTRGGSIHGKSPMKETSTRRKSLMDGSMRENSIRNLISMSGLRGSATSSTEMDDNSTRGGSMHGKSLMKDKSMKDTSTRRKSLMDGSMRENSIRNLISMSGLMKDNSMKDSSTRMKDSSTRKEMKDSSTRKAMKDLSMKDTSVRKAMKDSSMKDKSTRKTMKDGSSTRKKSSMDNSHHNGMRRSSTHSAASTASTVSNTSVGTSSPEKSVHPLKRLPRAKSTAGSMPTKQSSKTQRHSVPRSKTSNDGAMMSPKRNSAPSTTTTAKKPWWIPSTPTTTSSSTGKPRRSSKSNDNDMPGLASIEDAEELARRLAVERSRVEAAKARAEAKSKPRRTISVEEEAMAREEKARKEATERSRLEAVAARAAAKMQC